ncbi:DUF6415 family natural product biosynthesis protein [Streptomyces sp. SudanB52_2052]|uniref:DUF6415 family natural product biosynthesis protein n=1 Tax=Streptomyces sp. SudanB52_2052 TaxID=3035276 RepID=UPI0004A0DBC4|nr:hypothetical protein DF19_42175 [Streptomyces olindensis]
MIGTRSETDVPVPGVTAMRAQASWFLDQRTLPRHQATQLMARDLREFLEHLVPRIERLAAERSRDDAPVPAANVALAGVTEARRRMDEPEAAGLCGEVERVKSLARSVVSLCDHHDTLTGITVCLLCHHVIGDEAWVPFQRARPSGAGLETGRVHQRCAPAGRRTRR